MVDKKLLAEKLDSKEKYLAVVGSATSGSQVTQNSAIYFEGTVFRPSPVPWWHEREMMRMKHGVYKTSILTEALNAVWAGQHAVHVSREDPTQLAYTASVEDGERDKQLRVSPGRFLRKYFPLFSDKQIQHLEEAHKTDLDASYLVARSEEAIAEVYTNMSGDTGCMRRSGSSFGFGSSRHPSVAYTGPGFGVAYLLSSTKQVIARCVIWVNPDNSSDKRAVRVYGHPTLRRKLLADGFKFAPLTGAKLAKVPLPGQDKIPNRYYLPYLDGPEGHQTDTRGNCVRISTDGNFLEIISHETACAAPPGTVAGARTTLGCVTLAPPPQEEILTSVISGSRVRKYADNCKQCAKYVGEGNFVLGWAPLVELTAANYVLARYKELQATAIQVYARREFISNGIVLNAAGRAEVGAEQLSVDYYPTATYTTEFAVETDTQRKIKFEDTVGILPQSGDMQLYHVSRMPPVRGTHVKATPIPRFRHVVYIHKLRPTLQVFGTRTFFDSELYKSKFVKLSTSEEFVRTNTTRSYVFFGRELIVPRTMSRNAAATFVTREMIASYIGGLIRGNQAARQSACITEMANIFSNLAARVDDNSPMHLHWRPSYESVRRYHETMTAHALGTHPEQHRIFNIVHQELENVR